jgi:hypothetical protein
VAGLSGEPEWVAFPTAALPGRSAWAVAEFAEEPPPRDYDLRRVEYALRAYEDGGELMVEGLERLARKTALGRGAVEEEAEAVEGDEEIAPAGTLLTPRVKMVYFRYHDGYEWLDHWPPTEEDRADAEASGGAEADQAAREQRRAIDLPLAVEVTLGAEPLPAGMTVDEYRLTYRSFRRVVHVPAGARPLSGAILRGMGAGAR